MNIRAMRFLIFLLCAISGIAHAFRGIDVESYTDPDYKAYVPKKVLLVVQSQSVELRAELERKAQQEIEQVGFSVVKFRELFPPTRDWSQEQINDICQKEGVDSSLVISSGERSESIRQIGTQSFGSANYSGSNSSVNGSASTVKVNKAKSVAEFSAVLIEQSSGRKVWYADITVKAGGTLFVGAEKDARAAVDAVVEYLGKDGHLPVPPNNSLKGAP